MAIAYEGNADLAFDTAVLRKAGEEYRQVAGELRSMMQQLDFLLTNLKDSGWTTGAGAAFYEMTNTNWEENIEKYAALLETLNEILISSSQEYENLVMNHIRNTKIRSY